MSRGHNKNSPQIWVTCKCYSWVENHEKETALGIRKHNILNKVMISFMIAMGSLPFYCVCKYGFHTFEILVNLQELHFYRYYPLDTVDIVENIYKDPQAFWKIWFFFLPPQEDQVLSSYTAWSSVQYRCGSLEDSNTDARRKGFWVLWEQLWELTVT